jgi:HrpA-like RNA helicase
MLACHVQRNFEVTINYMAEPQATPNYNVLATNTAAMIHQNLGPGDILIFLPGQAEINQVCELLSKATKKLDIRPLYSELSASDQHLAFDCAGRTQNGLCFRLYSKEAFDKLAPSTAPAIRSKATHVAALRLISIGYIKVLDFDWIDSPHPEGVTRAAQDLLGWYVSKTESFTSLSPDGTTF